MSLQLSSRRIAGVALAAAGHEPVFDLDVLEACEVSCIDRDDRQAAGMSDRGDLTINIRGRPTEIFQSCPLSAMPGRSCFVVRQNGKGCLYDVRQIGFKSSSSFPARKRCQPYVSSCQTGAAIADSCPCFSSRLRISGFGALEIGDDTMLVSRRYLRVTKRPYGLCLSLERPERNHLRLPRL